MCWRRSERKRRRLVIAETEEQMGRFFSSYRKLLMSVPPFKYLVKIMLTSDDNCLAVKQNPQQTQEKWVQLVNLLGREGLYMRRAGRFYVAVVKEVLLFGS